MNTGALPLDPMPMRPLLPSHIHLWRASLDGLATSLPQWTAILSPQEQHRANRFRFERDRERFVVRRGVLRVVLARYLGLAPGEVELATAPNGKPTVSPACRRVDLRFSSSHSGGLACYAVTVGADVGVDVERIRPMPDLDDIARLYFAESERGALARRPAGAGRLEEFFRLWTTKEAVLKATGDGLTRPLASVEISADVTTGRARVALHRDTGDCVEWSVTWMTPVDGFVAAVATESAVSCDSTVISLDVPEITTRRRFD